MGQKTNLWAEKFSIGTFSKAVESDLLRTTGSVLATSCVVIRSILVDRLVFSEI